MNELPPEVGQQTWELMSGGCRRFLEGYRGKQKPLSKLTPGKGEGLSSTKVSPALTTVTPDCTGCRLLGLPQCPGDVPVAKQW